MGDYCFIVQPFDNGVFDQRYNDIIKPAVEACGLTPYRVDEDYGAEIPINTIAEKISFASLVIAEITTNNPNVWFELGYSLALYKPTILICSDEREEAYPFDVRHRKIITYSTKSLGDFNRFRENLELSISAKYPTSSGIKPDGITQEELMVLKFISRDQKTSFAITPENKIIKSILTKDKVLDCLKSLIRCGYLEYTYSTVGADGFYHITKRAEDVLSSE